MLARNRTEQGFTLIEILIVVVILGILAAIVIPQFTSASQSARASSLQSQLHTLRSQLELYQIQHNAVYPTLAQMWGNLTGQTDQAGGTGTEFGPYLQQAPTNPFTNGATVAVDNSGDWRYMAATGAIIAVVDATVAADANLGSNDFVAAP